jgi:type IV conjugative transfer system protein TraL
MANQYDHHVVIKTLDNPPRILFWEADEFIMIAAPVFIGIALGSLLVVFLGLFLKPTYARLKKRLGRGRIQRVIYWNFPKDAMGQLGVFKKLPPSHVREWLR